MNAMKHLIWAAGLAVVMLGGASFAKAEHNSVILRNRGSTVIHYQVKWGDGTWKNYDLQAGKERFHAFEFDENGYAPEPYVRFDGIANDGQISYKTYHLTPWEVSDPWSGKPYAFEWDGKLLDLFKD